MELSGVGIIQKIQEELDGQFREKCTPSFFTEPTFHHLFVFYSVSVSFQSIGYAEQLVEISETSTAIEW